MKNKDLKILVIGILLGVVATLILVRISDVVNQDEEFFDEDDNMAFSEMLESTTSAVESSESAVRETDLEQF